MSDSRDQHDACVCVCVCVQELGGVKKLLVNKFINYVYANGRGCQANVYGYINIF